MLSPKEKVALLVNLFSFKKRFPYDRSAQFKFIALECRKLMSCSPTEGDITTCHAAGENIAFSLYVRSLAF